MKQVVVCIAVVVEKLSTTAQHTPAPLSLSDLNRSAHHDLVVLITRRKADAVLGGYWELPGGKIEPDEAAHDCLARELLEEVGIQVQPLHSFPEIEHRYEHAHVRLLPYLCRRVSGLPLALEVDEVRWVAPEALAGYTFPPPNAPLIASLMQMLTHGSAATAPAPAHTTSHPRER